MKVLLSMLFRVIALLAGAVHPAANSAPRAAVTVPPAVTAPSTTTTTVADPVVVIVNPDGSCARTSLAEARKDNLQVVAVCPLDPGPGAGQTVTTLTPPEPSPYDQACEGPSGCPNTMAGGPPTSTP